MDEVLDEITYIFYRKYGEIQNVAWFASRHGQVLTKNVFRKTIRPAQIIYVDCPRMKTKRLYLKVLGKNKTGNLFVFLHRIIAELYVPGYQKGLQVDHLNGLKWDNRAENLEWVTAKENSRRYNKTADAIRRNLAVGETKKRHWEENKKQLSQ